jgi:hypothetical protein
MGLFSRLRIGLRLARGSLAVLRAHPTLLWFPLVGGIAGIAFVLTLLGGALAVTDGQTSPLLYAVVFVLYVGETFIASFFTAGLMYATRQAFRGETPSVRGGLAAAWRHKWPLLAWAVVAAVVGVLVRAIEESSDVGGKVVALLFGVAWGVLTYFVVPVVVFEDTSLTGMFSRSGQVVREVWGESLGAEAGVGIVTVLLVLVGLGLSAVAFLVIPTGTTAGFVAFLVVAGLFVLGAVLVGQTLSGIAKTAVYVYATEDESPRYFSNVTFGRR